MTEELMEMLLRYLNDMAERGDHEAKQLLGLLAEVEL